MRLFRFECDGLGIYEAVDKFCPRDDTRRSKKPDGSWLPKAGPAHSGAISFWKPLGLQKYENSGLKGWHESVVPSVELRVADTEELDVLYEDQFQVVGVHKMPTHFRNFIQRAESKFVDRGEGVFENRIGDHWETQNIAVNVVRLTAGARSSIPHCESLEEEFVYVLRGTPLVWLDGHLYRLSAGYAVGFPAGTGLCHTFLNDSQDDALLLVLGERSKKDNQWIYPLNPELKAEQAHSWWDSWPSRELGPHPGKFDPSYGDIQKKLHPAIVYAPDLEPRKSFSYTGDTETFSLGFRLSDTLKMKALGVWHERLISGKRTSWPHAQSKEEEFALILKGHPRVWLNGWVKTLSPGDVVYFKPGAGVAHCLLGGDEESEFLVWGQPDEACPNDKIYYPFHERRNNECRETNCFWDDFKMMEPVGSHDGRP